MADPPELAVACGLPDEVEGPLNLVVDCDAGVDDLFAVILAARHPRTRLLAVSVVGGNVPTREGVRFARTALDLAGARGVPVLWGLDEGGVPPEGRDSDAIATELRKVLEGAGDPTVLVATGSLTNVAAVLRRFPDEVAQALREIVVLGGAFHVAGNISPLAERNVYSDAEAAHEVFEASIPLTLVPVDVSGSFTIPPDVFEGLKRAESLLDDYLLTILDPLSSYYEVVFGADACPIHDPLAVLVALAPNLFRCMKAKVSVELRGESTRGVTVMDLRPEAILANQDSHIRIVRELLDPGAAWEEIKQALGLSPVSPGT